MQDIKALKTQFLEYVEIERGRSLNTVRNYDHYLSKFFEFGKIQKASDITEETIRQFRLALKSFKWAKDSWTICGNHEKNNAELLYDCGPFFSQVSSQTKCCNGNARCNRACKDRLTRH
jgi:site-specific recombinase XerC